MAAPWFTYCTRSAGALLPEQLAAGVLATDLIEAAERAGVNYETAASMLSRLVGENTDFEAFNAFRLCDPERLSMGVVRIDRCAWSADAMVTELEDLKNAGHPSCGQIAAYMSGVVERMEVSIEKNGPMASVIARAASLCLAGWYGGIIQTPRGEWLSVDEVEGFRELPVDQVRATPVESSPTLRYAAADIRTGKSTGVAGPRPVLPVPELETFREPVPKVCPRCNVPLYSTARPLPPPSLSVTGQLIMGTGIIIGASAWIGSALWLRETFHLWTRAAGLVGIVLFPLAIVPGLGMGLLAHRRPKVLKLNCRSCGWRQQIIWG